MTLIFSRLVEIVEIHAHGAHAKFHQAECSGSRVIVLTEKKLVTMPKTIGLLPLLPRAVIIITTVVNADVILMLVLL